MLELINLDFAFLLLTATTFVVAAVPFALDIRRGQFDALSIRTAFVTFYVLQFVLCPLWAMLGGYSFAGTVPLTFLTTRKADGVLAQGYSSLALATFLAGHWLTYRRTKVQGNYKPLGLNRRVSLMSIVVLSLTGICSFFALAHTEGGVARFLVGIDDFRNNRLLGVGYYFYGMHCLYMAFVLACVTSFLYGNFRKTAVALFVLSVSVGFAGAFRHMAIDTMSTALVLTHWPTSRQRIKPKVIALVALSILFLNIVYNQFRESAGDFAVGSGSRSSLSDIVYYGFVARFNGIEPLARIIDETREAGHGGGRELLASLATFWIPRAWWEEKPVSFGAKVNVTFFPEAFRDVSQTGAAVPTLVGSLHWIGGPALVVFGMLLLGTCVGRIDRLHYLRADAVMLIAYTQIYSLALFINEAIDLHLGRFAFRVAAWTTVLLICGFQLPKVSYVQRKGCRVLVRVIEPTHV